MITAIRNASSKRLGRQMAVLMVFVGVLLSAHGEAEALLCELETKDSQLMSTVAEVESSRSSQVARRVALSEGSAAFECSGLSQENCDLNLPGGQPQPPNSLPQLRPSAALPLQPSKLLSPPPARPLYAELPGGLRAGHYPILYRPPRS